MDNGHQNMVNLNQEDWQRSLEISAPTNLPSPDEIKEKSNDFFAAEPPRTAEPLKTAESPDTLIRSEEEPAASETLETPKPQNSHTSSELPFFSGSKQTEEYGQVVPVAGPKAQEAPESRSFNSVNIRTIGDHLENSTIPEIDNAISELNQTGNLSNFYDEIRGEGSMLDANLSNSFNRKIGTNPLEGKG